MKKDIKEIALNFCIPDDIKEIKAVTTGHINDSYLITTGNDSGYFLQWINSYIFKDVASLMKNIEIVTRHIASKVKSRGHDDFMVLELIPTHDGSSYYCTPAGEYWRMYRNIQGTHSYDVVENTAIAFEGGKAFGRFMSDLADLPANQLTDTIPHFHDMEVRLANFRASLEQDPVGRAKEIPEDIRFVKDRMTEMLRIPELIRNGNLPLRITHNDTKFNNILFNADNKAVCIVDLDTVMPGSVLFDFGDAIRTGANMACEDEQDLSKVGINLPIFEAYARGFIQSTQQSLNSEEIGNLAFSARFMTFIIGLRFLTDYVDGDPYFRTNYPNHNLDRARVQFRLVESMEQNAAGMDAIIRKALSD
jgi:hypothetical protein